ncbi:MAG: 9-O-acetylesterase, partial [Tepidisphaeraceae bacterium]
ACEVALGMVYGRPVEYLGPVYDSHIVEGAAIRIRFKHVGKGLAFKHADALQGFAIAGEDRVFHWAAATIDGASVVVHSEKVTKPQAVRYAWANKRTWANLFNKDGLPAAPFRTDTW